MEMDHKIRRTNIRAHEGSRIGHRDRELLHQEARSIYGNIISGKTTKRPPI